MNFPPKERTKSTGISCVLIDNLPAILLFVRIDGATIELAQTWNTAKFNHSMPKTRM